MPPTIRVLAVAVPRQDTRYLVERGEDATTGEQYWRAIGGGIAFGERAEVAVRREWQEEFGLMLRDVRLLGVLENLFTYRGAPGHEVVFVFEAGLVERWPYERPEFTVTEPASVDAPVSLTHVARWVTAAELSPPGLPLYPTGLLELLEKPR